MKQSKSVGFKKTLNRGFTLVEMVIVIAVIAVLTAILVPTFAGIFEKAEDAKLQVKLENTYTSFLADYREFISDNCPGLSMKDVGFEYDGEYYVYDTEEEKYTVAVDNTDFVENESKYKLRIIASADALSEDTLVYKGQNEGFVKKAEDDINVDLYELSLCINYDGVFVYLLPAD